MNDPQRPTAARRPRGAPLDHAPEGVAYARRQAGLTQQELGAVLGLTRQRIWDIEAGRRNASPELLERMAARLDCPLVVLQAKPTGDEKPRRSEPPKAPEGAARAP
ncbi:helix-turn-helix transcriptional regulator [Streptomyces griseoincarnatus]